MSNILVIINTKPEDIIVSKHNFKAVSQFDAKMNYFRCLDCNVSAEWNKQLYVSEMKDGIETP